MKIAFYPGSFNPWHQGHLDVLNKALYVFDKIVILQLTNTDKGDRSIEDLNHQEDFTSYGDKVEVLTIKDVSIVVALGNYLLGIDDMLANQYMVIRGLRNEQDFCAEQIQQYWYEDLGVKMPIVYFIADRSMVHMSSSAVRSANRFTEK